MGRQIESRCGLWFSGPAVKVEWNVRVTGMDFWAPSSAWGPDNPGNLWVLPVLWEPHKE